MSYLGPVVPVVHLFAQERACLREVLSELDTQDWARPTVCPGWDVHDVVAHILNDHLRRLSGTRDGHRGFAFEPGETLPSFVARINEDFVVGMRQASPRVMLDLLSVAGEQLDQVWAQMDPMGPASVDVSWAQIDDGASPAWLDIAREYTEFWVHQQQFRDAVDRPGAQQPHLLGPVLRTFARALPAALDQVQRPPGTAVGLIVDGPAGGTWTAVREPTRWVLTEDLDGSSRTTIRPGATVQLQADDVWRLGSRGVTPAQALERARVHGDEELVRAAAGLLAVVA